MANARVEVRARDARCHAPRGRHAAEHGDRAPRPRDSRSRSRECARQVRGEWRAPRPRGRALTRHAQRRPLPRAVRRRDTRHAVCLRRWREPRGSKVVPPAILPGPSRAPRDKRAPRSKVARTHGSDVARPGAGAFASGNGAKGGPTARGRVRMDPPDYSASQVAGLEELHEDGARCRGSVAWLLLKHGLDAVRSLCDELEQVELLRG
jgi:hypothetical protein